MNQQELLRKIKYHWHLYIARGGFNAPRMTVGKLHRGGIEHWSKFLQSGRRYVTEYPESEALKKDLDFLPRTMLRLLLGD